MTEQEKLKYYEEHDGNRPPETYVIYRIRYDTGYILDRKVQEFKTKEEAVIFCRELAETCNDTGRIILLFIERNKATDETVTEDFEEFHQMFWPKAVNEAMQTFFEVL